MNKPAQTTPLDPDAAAPLPLHGLGRACAPLSPTSLFWRRQVGRTSRGTTDERVLERREKSQVLCVPNWERKWCWLRSTIQWIWPNFKPWVNLCKNLDIHLLTLSWRPKENLLDPTKDPRQTAHNPVSRAETHRSTLLLSFNKPLSERVRCESGV